MRAWVALSIGLLIFVISCQAQTQMTGRDGRIAISGVSVLPPQERNWQTILASTYQLALQKRNANATYVAVVQVYKLPTVASAEEFKNTISQGRAAEPDTGRFKTLKNEEELSLEREGWCVKYHTIVEDRGSKTPSGTLVMVREERGYHCQHSADKNVGVWFAYSLRQMPGQRDPDLEQKARAFLEQVQFTAF